MAAIFDRRLFAYYDDYRGGGTLIDQMADLQQCLSEIDSELSRFRFLYTGSEGKPPRDRKPWILNSHRMPGLLQKLSSPAQAQASVDGDSDTTESDAKLRQTRSMREEVQTHVQYTPGSTWVQLDTIAFNKARHPKDTLNAKYVVYAAWKCASETGSATEPREVCHEMGTSAEFVVKIRQQLRLEPRKGARYVVATVHMRKSVGDDVLVGRCQLDTLLPISREAHEHPILNAKGEPVGAMLRVRLAMPAGPRASVVSSAINVGVAEDCVKVTGVGGLAPMTDRSQSARTTERRPSVRIASEPVEAEKHVSTTRRPSVRISSEPVEAEQHLTATRRSSVRIASEPNEGGQPVHVPTTLRRPSRTVETTSAQPSETQGGLVVEPTRRKSFVTQDPSAIPIGQPIEAKSTKDGGVPRSRPSLTLPITAKGTTQVASAKGTTSSVAPSAVKGAAPASGAAAKTAAAAAAVAKSTPAQQQSKSQPKAPPSKQPEPVQPAAEESQEIASEEGDEEEALSEAEEVVDPKRQSAPKPAAAKAAAPRMSGAKASPAVSGPVVAAKNEDGSESMYEEGEEEEMSAEPSIEA